MTNTLLSTTGPAFEAVSNTIARAYMALTLSLSPGIDVGECVEYRHDSGICEGIVMYEFDNEEGLFLVDFGEGYLAMIYEDDLTEIDCRKVEFNKWDKRSKERLGQ